MNATHVCVCVSLSLVACRGALSSALSTDSPSVDTDFCFAAEVWADGRTKTPCHCEAAFALYVATASAVSAHGRLVAITLLTEHLVALCRHLFCMSCYSIESQCLRSNKSTYLHLIYAKNNKIGDKWLTTFAGPRVKDLIRMTSRIGEDPIVAAVVERTRVIRRWVVAVRLSIALILASTCDVGHVHSQNKCCSKI